MTASPTEAEPAREMVEAIQERAAIVAWLRSEADWHAKYRDAPKVCALTFAADMIEVGDHHGVDPAFLHASDQSSDKP